MFNILIVEDDKNTGKLLGAVLKNEGYCPFVAENGLAALDVLDNQHIDLLIVDEMMPKMGGCELTRQLRSNGSELPILMVTAKQEQKDKKQGFLVGVDDYMIKPVDEEEMLLRIKALLRRSKIVSEHKLTIGAVTLDYDCLTVTREKITELLPKKEFYLLFKLLSYPDIIFTRLQLMDEIWGMETETDDHSVNVHISRLRTKFESFPEFEIVTVRGLGYKAVKKI